MNDFQKGWVSAFIDGEGCFGINDKRQKRLTMRLQVNNGDLDSLLKLKEYTGLGKIYGPYEYKGTLPNGKDYYRWTVSKQDELNYLISEIYEFLSARRQKTIDNLRFSMV